MQILVTGASGAIGSALVPALLAQGHTVLAQSRKLPRTSAQPGVNWCESNLEDVGQLRGLLEQCQAVVHLASPRRGSGTRDFSAIERHSRCLCQAARGLALQHIVVASSAGIYGERQGIIEETTAIAPDNGYRLAKWHSELVLRRSGLPISLVRLPIVLGPQAADWRAPLRAFRAPDFRFLGAGRNRFHPIHMDDAVSSLVLALQARPQCELPYLAAGADPVTSAEAARLFGARPVATLPGLPFQLLLKASSRLFRISRIEWRFPHRYEFFVRDTEYRFERTRQLLGFQPRFTVAQAIESLP